MAVVYPKVVKPWRGYPSANVIMAIRLRVLQNPVIDPVGMLPLGTIALTKDKAVHVGTIPKGAFILPSFRHVKTVFPAAGTIKIGTKTDAEAILKGADSAITTLGVSSGLVGNQTGITTAELQLFAVLDTVEASGEIDIVTPFYIQKD
ncbi:MAG: hypothetical protein EHM13_11610 [Acidobacteria bacterium]|nr:MAG: hypothetical protein EHM13_11610 [Acidobacteriota bacterium]